MCLEGGELLAVMAEAGGGLVDVRGCWNVDLPASPETLFKNFFLLNEFLFSVFTVTLMICCLCLLQPMSFKFLSRYTCSRYVCSLHTSIRINGPWFQRIPFPKKITRENLVWWRAEVKK